MTRASDLWMTSFPEGVELYSQSLLNPGDLGIYQRPTVRPCLSYYSNPHLRALISGSVSRGPNYTGEIRHPEP